MNKKEREELADCYALLEMAVPLALTTLLSGKGDDGGEIARETHRYFWEFYIKVHERVSLEMSDNDELANRIETLRYPKGTIASQRAPPEDH